MLGVTDRNVDMVAEGVDCVLRIGELKDSRMVVRRIGAALMVTCASPRYLEEFGEPICLSDLPEHRSVNFLSGSVLTPKDAILVNDSHAYVECAASGFGIVQAPGVLVDRYLADGRLREILVPFRPLPRPVSVLYPSKRYLAPQVRVFVDWIQERFTTLHGIWLTHP